MQSQTPNKIWAQTQIANWTKMRTEMQMAYHAEAKPKKSNYLVL